MSGGELQMVLIARALINEPKLIILDEPETGLDFHNQILVLNMIDRLSHEGRHQRNHEHALSDQRHVCRRRGFYDESQRHFFLRQHGKVLTEKNISVSFDVNVVCQ